MTKSDKPGAVFNLDALDDEGGVEPFEFAVQGKRFVMQDPSDLDWRDLATLGSDLRSDLETLLGAEQFEKFDALKGVSGKQVRRLISKASEHYGVGSPEA